QREDLNPLEEAGGVQRLIGEFKLTHQEAAQAIGRSRTATTNLLRLLNLAKTVQALVFDGKLEMGHARALLALDGRQQESAAKRVADRRAPTRNREIHGRAPRVAPRRRFPNPLLDLFRPGDLCPGARAHFLRSELELRGARGGATAPGRFQAYFHRRKAGRGGARRGRLYQRRRESLRPPRRAVLPEASRQRRRVHVSLPPVDL